MHADVVWQMKPIATWQYEQHCFACKGYDAYSLRYLQAFEQAIIAAIQKPDLRMLLNKCIYKTAATESKERCYKHLVEQLSWSAKAWFVFFSLKQHHWANSLIRAIAQADGLWQLNITGIELNTSACFSKKALLKAVIEWEMAKCSKCLLAASSKWLSRYSLVIFTARYSAFPSKLMTWST